MSLYSLNGLLLIFLTSYEIILFFRTDWLSRRVSVGSDVIFLFYLIWIATVLVCVLLMIFTSKRVASVFLIWSILVGVSFASLNLSGYLFTYTKGNGTGSENDSTSQP